MQIKCLGEGSGDCNLAGTLLCDPADQAGVSSSSHILVAQQKVPCHLQAAWRKELTAVLRSQQPHLQQMHAL